MKFYLDSDKDCEPYADLKNNKLMQKYLQEIQRETDAKVTFEKDTKFKDDQHIVVDIPSMKSLAQIMKAIDIDLVIELPFDESQKYPTLGIYDDYIE